MNHGLATAWPSALRGGLVLMALLVACLAASTTFAQDTPPTEGAPTAETAAPEETAAPAETPATPTIEEKFATLTLNVNALWTCLAAFLVFWMQAGFALVETGLTRAKNTCNILMKNLMDFAIGSIAYWLVGFGIMFGTATAMNGFLGVDNFIYSGSDNFTWAFFLFQTVFCATAATIVSGAMAERTKFQSYLVYTLLISLIVYPIFGKWAWGSLMNVGADNTYAGWLEAKGIFGIWNNGIGFADFAGSTVVHSVGGWCALAGAMILGPRLGRYGKDGKVNPIPGHNIPLVALGVFILWLGWFGFNPGSTTDVSYNFAEIAACTNIAGAAGAMTSLLTSWLLFKKPDPSMTLNGVLAGLVAITAGCNAVSMSNALIIGAVAGVLVVIAVPFFDKLKIDDPVGAISVHAVNGVFGTLAVGLFHKDNGLITQGKTEQLIAQVVGAGTAFAWAFPVSLIIFLGIKYTIGLRADAQEELDGLDITEHGMYGYPQGWVAQETNSSGSAHAVMQTGATKPATAH
jgi:Amt family ammonium transporter